MNDQQKEKYFKEFEEIGEADVLFKHEAQEWLSSNLSKHLCAKQWLLRKSNERDVRTDLSASEAASAAMDASLVARRALYMAILANIIAIIGMIKENIFQFIRHLLH